MIQAKRLYIVTGKGGVGKTTIAKSLTTSLIKQNINAKYAYIANSDINSENTFDCEVSEVPLFPLNMKTDTAEYIRMKLKSKLLAKAVMSAPFFKSLVSMVPGFNYLVHLGKIIYELEQDSSLTLVLDSPSSGHALMMLSMADNFKEIFKSGIVFEDAKRMQDFLSDPSNVEIKIVSLLTELAMQESLEFKSKSSKLFPLLVNQIIANDALALQGGAPLALMNKVKNQQQVLKDYSSQITKVIHHQTAIASFDTSIWWEL